MIDVRDDGDISQVADHIEYSWPRSRQGFAGTGIILGNLCEATVSCGWCRNGNLVGNTFQYARRGRIRTILATAAAVTAGIAVAAANRQGRGAGGRSRPEPCGAGGAGRLWRMRGLRRTSRCKAPGYVPGGAPVHPLCCRERAGMTREWFVICGPCAGPWGTDREQARGACCDSRLPRCRPPAGQQTSIKPE